MILIVQSIEFDLSKWKTDIVCVCTAEGKKNKRTTWQIC